MEQGITGALIVMLIGMVTVFIILALVVFIGKALIRATNRFWPELEPVKPKAVSHAAPNRQVAAIVTAVDIITGGRGKVTSIKKL